MASSCDQGADGSSSIALAFSAERLACAGPAASHEVKILMHTAYVHV